MPGARRPRIHCVLPSANVGVPRLPRKGEEELQRRFASACADGLAFDVLRARWPIRALPDFSTLRVNHRSHELRSARMPPLTQHGHRGTPPSPIHQHHPHSTSPAQRRRGGRQCTVWVSAQRCRAWFIHDRRWRQRLLGGLNTSSDISTRLTATLASLVPPHSVSDICTPLELQRHIESETSE